MADDPLDSQLDRSPRARLKRFAMGIINTRYFFIAVLIHIIFLALIGTTVLFESVQMKGLFQSETQVLVATPPGPPPPPPSMPQSEKSDATATASAAAASRPPDNSVARIATQKMSTSGVNVPPPDIPQVVANIEIQSSAGAQERVDKAEIGRMQGVRSFHEGGVTGANGKRGASGKGKDLVAEFTCYVGQYQGGDWNCNLGRIAPPPPAPEKDRKWYGNCIHNLALQINRWTKGNIKAKLKTEYLKLSEREWLDVIKPPFIFITGHKNFTFTEVEVENLREFLMVGGLLWVDNSLPGRRSRFDIALRREMKRVLSDRDFEKIDNKHPIYNSYFKMDGPPKGMNFYQEPTEVIKIGGDIVLVYTLNAYSDMWESALLDKMEGRFNAVDSTREWVTGYDYMSNCGPHWDYIYNHRINSHYYHGRVYYFFRNLNTESVNASYQFGINVVAYLLTRFQDKFMTLPRSA